MKKFFTTLILVFGIFISGFTQSQELNTLIETLVRPDNLDSYFEHQIDYYQEYYEELKLEVEEMIEDEKSIKKRIQAKKKIKRKDQVLLDETNERLSLLKEDLNFIDKFISLWNGYSNQGGKLRKEFEENYDLTACYLFETEYEKLEPHEYEITFEEIHQELSWKEVVDGIENYKKGERIEIQPAGTKWEKRKKPNCHSSNPEDCVIWCMIQTPAEYGIAEESGVNKCPDSFEISADEKYCYRTISIINERESIKKLVIKDRDFPDREIKIKNYTVIDCKN